MQKVEELFQMKCQKGNQVSFLCVKQECPHSSLMLCNAPKCKCYANHKYCMAIMSIDSIKSNLEEKGKKYIPFITNIYNTYEDLMKLLTVEIQECRKIIDQNKVYLIGKEKILYQYLKEGKSESITSCLVNLVMRSIFEQHEYNFTQYQKQIQLKSSQIKKIIEETKPIKDKHKNKPLKLELDCKFYRRLCSSDILIVNDKTILSDNLSQKTACIQIPSELKCSSYKFVFKLNNSRYNPPLRIGVCQLSPNININDDDIDTKIQYGALTCPSNSKVFLGSVLGHKQESNNINSFQKGDIIEVLYGYVEKKVTVINSTKKTQSVSYIQIDQNFHLYLAITLFLSTEIELLSITC